ncbi:MAG: ATP-binding protein [Candidatus Korarchaeota archaeon]|nr:ATP-binding protein [Candidatus Korarchaeota archaeon]
MIVSVSGGKGGTGKSTVAVNLAILLAEGRKLVMADLDVEDPNDHILLGVSLEGERPVNIMLPFIRYDDCIKCGECGRVCDTGAMLISPDGLPYVIPRLCSGCRACYFVCPTRAIVEGERTIGYTYHTVVERGSKFDLVTGVLREGEEHTPPAVLAARERAFSLPADLYMVDTSAGTSNSVATAMDGSRLVIAVTEPTPLGLHDLELILRLTQKMGIETWVVMNRSGLGSEERHEEVVRRYGSEIVARIPYSKRIVESYVRGEPIVLLHPDSEEAQVFRELASMIEGVI